MNKAELMNVVAEKTGRSKSDVEIIFSAIIETMTERLVNQDKVTLLGFGSFVTKVREERKGRNPSTGKEMTIPKTIAATFKAATPLKERLNKGARE